MKGSWEVSRRAILGGAGATIGLPILEAMLPGLKRAGAAGLPPKRLVFFIMGTGTPEHQNGRRGTFTPQGTGTGYALSPILQPLANFKQDITVVTGLHNSIATYRADAPEDPIDHPRSTMGLLTGTYVDKNFTANISIDQVAANAFKAFTPGRPSMFMDAVYDVDSYEYDNYYCWTGPKTPIKLPLINSSQVFGQVFGGNGVDPAILRRENAYKKRVLDHAKLDVARIRAKLGTADKATLDQYLTSIHDLEGTIAAPIPVSTGMCSSVGAPAADGFVPTKNDAGPVAARVDQMINLVKLAFQCDRTRVIVFLLGHSGIESRVNWVPGLDTDAGWTFHGDISHPAGHPDGQVERRLDAYQKISTWNIEQFGKLLQVLKDTPEGDGSGKLLDNTLLLCTSEMSYGDGHWLDHLPIVLAGGAGGSAISLGQHIEVREQPIANLYLTMLNAVGVGGVTKFGNSTGSLALG